MKKILLAVLLFIAALIALVFINPQINPSHSEPYLALAQEAQSAAPDAETVQQRVVLFGDAGHSAIEPWQASLAKIAQRASQMPNKTVVVALGDNIYMQGFPQREDGQEAWTEDQLESISYLDAQLKVAKVSKAPLYLVPGNHDWLASELDGQAQHIDNYAAEHNLQIALKPRETGQAPLPEALDFPGLSIVFVDSEWWRVGDAARSAAAEAAMAASFSSIRQQHPNNLILVAQHHPLVTEGPHGGYLSDFSYWLIMNILYQLFDEAAAQDIFHASYMQMIQAQNRVMSQFDRVIHAAGHEHSLQLIQPAANTSASYLLVSGAANDNKVSGVWHNEDTRFAHSKEGFVELDVTASGVYFRAFSSASDKPTAEFWLHL